MSGSGARLGSDSAQQLIEAAERLERSLEQLARAHRGWAWQGLAAETYYQERILLQLRAERSGDELRQLAQVLQANAGV